MFRISYFLNIIGLFLATSSLASSSLVERHSQGMCLGKWKVEETLKKRTWQLTSSRQVLTHKRWVNYYTGNFSARGGDSPIESGARMKAKSACKNIIRRELEKQKEYHAKITTMHYDNLHCRGWKHGHWPSYSMRYECSIDKCWAHFTRQEKSYSLSSWSHFAEKQKTKRPVFHSKRSEWVNTIGLLKNNINPTSHLGKDSYSKQHNKITYGNLSYSNKKTSGPLSGNYLTRQKVKTKFYYSKTASECTSADHISGLKLNEKAVYLLKQVKKMEQSGTNICTNEHFKAIQGTLWKVRLEDDQDLEGVQSLTTEQRRLIEETVSKYPECVLEGDPPPSDIINQELELGPAAQELKDIRILRTFSIHKDDYKCNYQIWYNDRPNSLGSVSLVIDGCSGSYYDLLTVFELSTHEITTPFHPGVDYTGVDKLEPGTEEHTNFILTLISDIEDIEDEGVQLFVEFLYEFSGL